MRILIICSANRCRSVAAQAIFQQTLSSSGQSIEIHTAGLHVKRGQPADPMMIRALQRRGFHPDIFHRSRTIQEVMHQTFDAILVMDQEQRQRVSERYPHYSHKIWLMASNEQPVADPYRMGWSACLKTIEQLEQHVHDWCERWGVQHAVCVE